MIPDTREVLGHLYAQAEAYLQRLGPPPQGQRWVVQLGDLHHADMGQMLLDGGRPYYVTDFHFAMRIRLEKTE